MSALFTSTAGASWQTLLTEITTAYSERRQVLGQSEYTPVENRDVHPAAYWRTFQEWLETNCTSFVDHVNGPLNASNTRFLYFTLESWRAAAGINAGGFARTTSTNASAFGQMQVGDAIKGDVFREIQAGFGALRWSLKNADTKSIDVEALSYGQGSSSADCQSVYDAIVPTWDSMEWSDGSAYPDSWVYLVVARYGPYLSTGYQFAHGRFRSKVAFSDISDCAQKSYVVYARPETHLHYDFYDIDGIGFKEGKLFEWESFDADDETEKQSSMISDDRDSPLAKIGAGCPVSVLTEYGVKITSDNCYCLLKWNFTNT